MSILYMILYAKRVKNIYCTVTITHSPNHQKWACISHPQTVGFWHWLSRPGGHKPSSLWLRFSLQCWYHSFGLCLRVE